jgi:hypothetical protein
MVPFVYPCLHIVKIWIVKSDMGNTPYRNQSQSFSATAGIGRTPLARISANGIGGQGYRGVNGMKGMGGGRAVYGRK